MSDEVINVDKCHAPHCKDELCNMSENIRGMKIKTLLGRRKDHLNMWKCI